MNLHIAKSYWSRQFLLFATACLLTVGIGGTTVAGIQGSGLRRMVAFGTVSTSGGLTVNGVTYDASGARVIVNGHGATASSVHAGHVVAVQGTTSPDGSRVTAEEVLLVSDIRGEITVVDTTANAVQVLGQTVRLTGESVLDPSIQPANVTGLRPGMVVSVSGFATTEGTYIASRIDTEAALQAAQVRGAIQALDGWRKSLRIGALTVDYATASIEGTLAEGAIVTVEGLAPSPNDSLVATTVEVFAGLGHDGERGDLEGIITAFASSSDFEVNGQPFLADSKTVYVLHAGELTGDVLVRVKGNFNSAGILLADKIQTDAPKIKQSENKQLRPGKPAAKK